MTFYVAMAKIIDRVFCVALYLKQDGFASLAFLRDLNSQMRLQSHCFLSILFLYSLLSEVQIASEGLGWCGEFPG